MRLQNPVIHLLKSIRNYQTVAPQRAEPETFGHEGALGGYELDEITKMAGG